MMSQLQAVNRLLSTIGESPVLSTSIEYPEVVRALEVLDETSKEVLAKHWHFNSDTNYPLTPNSQGEIELPADCLRIDASNTLEDLVPRNGKLYSRTRHSYQFYAPVYVDITHYFPFETLPYPAQHYIVIRASRRYQREVLGSVQIDQYTREEEQQAYIALVDFDGAGADYNLLDNNPQIQQLQHRGGFHDGFI